MGSNKVKIETLQIHAAKSTGLPCVQLRLTKLNMSLISKGNYIQSIDKILRLGPKMVID